MRNMEQYQNSDFNNIKDRIKNLSADTLNKHIDFIASKSRNIEVMKDQSVSMTALGMLFTGYYIIAIITVFLIHFITIIIISILTPLNFFLALFFGVISIWPIALFAYIFAYKKAQKEFMREFSKQFNYYFNPIGSLENRVGSLFNTGNQGRVENVISGEYLEQHIEIFNYSFSRGISNRKKIYSYTILELDFPIELPELFLENKKGEHFSDQTQDSREVRLEGNFSDLFSLRIRSKFEIEALQIFTPDLMQRLTDKYSNVSIEFTKNHIYIYEDKFIEKFSEIIALHDLAKDLIEHIIPIMHGVGKSVSAMKDQFYRNQLN